MLRAVAHAIPSAASVVSQRHAESPATPPSAQKGHSRARNPQEGSTWDTP